MQSNVNPGKENCQIFIPFLDESNLKFFFRNVAAGVLSTRGFFG